MGKVVEFPGKVKELDIFNIKEADMLMVGLLDDDLVPIYADGNKPVWHGVLGFWTHKDEMMSVRLIACFKERSDAVSYAASKHHQVETAMPSDIITRMRMELAGMHWTPDTKPPEDEDDPA